MLEPLLDRIEVIEIDDYTFQEKKDITEKFLIPSTLKEYGFESANQTIEFGSGIMERVIKEFSYSAGGVRGIKRNIEKLVRKANYFLMQNKDINSLVIDPYYLNLFLGDKKTYDENFIKLLNNLNDPGSLITADYHGEIIKMIIKPKITSRKLNPTIEDISSRNILKHVNMIGKIEKHVEEALQISIELAREKIIDLLNENVIDHNYEHFLKEYNVYITNPYHKKKGNTYGLAFYIGLLSATLDVKMPLTDLLIVGELSPHGNILKVHHLKNLLNIAEFYDIKNLILPEGNREEYNKFIETSKKKYNVFFVKTDGDAFNIIFKGLKDKKNKLNIPQNDNIINLNVKNNLL